jgi:hypothetical protein
MSFAFSGAKSEWNDDYDQRRITSLSMHRGDVSVVVAYGQTRSI